MDHVVRGGWVTIAASAVGQCRPRRNETKGRFFVLFSLNERAANRLQRGLQLPGGGLVDRILRASSMRALGIRSSYEGRMVNA